MPFDLLQVVLVLTIVVLTALLTVLGIEVFYILKDVRRILDRVNNVVNDAEHVVTNIKKPAEMIGGIAHSADLLSKLFEMVKHHEANKQEHLPVVVEQKHRAIESEDLAEDETEYKQPINQKQVSLGRRFFRIPRRPVS